MEPLHFAHLAVLAAWGGLVLAEIVIELSSRTTDDKRHAARLHYRLDVILELPMLAAVLGTGLALAIRAWPLTPLHIAKIGAGLAAIAANLYCVVQVVLRRQRVNDEVRLAAHTRRVFASAIVGVPFGLLAGCLGFLFFRR
jgi:hypothetical protein